MKSFQVVDVNTIDEITTILKPLGKKAEIIAGGSDILGTLKDKIYPDYPEYLVNLNPIKQLAYIKEESGALKVGALTLLADIADNAIISTKYVALAQSARSVGTPQLRNMGTIGGNICQEARCWYLRSANNKFNCLKKNQQGLCYALTGDNRYHSIFGAVNGCVCVNPSDVAPALVAFGASVVTNKRTIPIDEFFDVVVAPNKSAMTVLEEGEIVTEIRVPEPTSGAKSVFMKFAMRNSIDFPIVNCAAVIGGGKASICLNAVSGKPRRLAGAEEAIAGKDINQENAEAAANAAIKGTMAITNNKYKIQIAKTLVKRAILACK